MAFERMHLCNSGLFSELKQTLCSVWKVKPFGDYLNGNFQELTMISFSLCRTGASRCCTDERCFVLYAKQCTTHGVGALHCAHPLDYFTRK